MGIDRVIKRMTKKARASEVKAPEPVAEKKPVSLAERHKAFQDAMDALMGLISDVLDVQDLADKSLGQNVINMVQMIEARLKNEQKIGMLARAEVSGPKETTLPEAVAAIAPFLSEAGRDYLTSQNEAFISLPNPNVQDDLKAPLKEEPKT